MTGEKPVWCECLNLEKGEVKSFFKSLRSEARHEMPFNTFYFFEVNKRCYALTRSGNTVEVFRNDIVSVFGEC